MNEGIFIKELTEEVVELNNTLKSILKVLKLIADSEPSLKAKQAAERVIWCIESLAEISTSDPGKTYFEGSPTKDPECFNRWKRLNDSLAALQAALTDIQTNAETAEKVRSAQARRSNEVFRFGGINV